MKALFHSVLYIIDAAGHIIVRLGSQLGMSTPYVVQHIEKFRTYSERHFPLSVEVLAFQSLYSGVHPFDVNDCQFALDSASGFCCGILCRFGGGFGCPCHIYGHTQPNRRDDRAGDAYPDFQIALSSFMLRVYHST